jgi:hypothetical protein
MQPTRNFFVAFTDLDAYNTFLFLLLVALVSCVHHIATLTKTFETSKTEVEKKAAEKIAAIELKAEQDLQTFKLTAEKMASDKIAAFELKAEQDLQAFKLAVEKQVTAEKLAADQKVYIDLIFEYNADVGKPQTQKTLAMQQALRKVGEKIGSKVEFPTWRILQGYSTLHSTGTHR